MKQVHNVQYQLSNGGGFETRQPHPRLINPVYVLVDFAALLMVLEMETEEQIL